MKHLASIILLLQAVFSVGQNPLYIPPALTGTTFNLNVQSGTQTFYGATATPTYGINSAWMAPTVIVNKGDSVTLNVINGLNVRTTMHWHGLHVSAMNDGGPHQTINAGATWSPSFKIRNNAATYWYHPHGAGQTEQQISKGLAGLLIVKDSVEAALTLPRNYGVDDVPIIVQSRAFDNLQQIAIASDMDTALFVNGTLNPQFDAPAQVVRFRLLNASSLRSYNFGFTNNQLFYQIGTDGGLLDTPVTMTRLRLSPGERAEILVNFSGMASQTSYLRGFNSELPNGIYGAEMVGMGSDTIHEYEDNYLNGADFNLVRFNIVSPTATPVTAIPNTLATLTPISAASATKNRTIVMDTIRLLPMDVPNHAEGPFGMNGKTFDMDSINEVVYLNTIETWTLVNRTLVAHPFHIHDIQFNVLEKSGMAPPVNERGWKDVVLVMPGDSVKFITKFETFADAFTPYMFHCHLLHHEDDGMMGSFLVIDTNATGIEQISQSNFEAEVSPNPASDYLNVSFSELAERRITLLNSMGESVYEKSSNSNLAVPMMHLSKGLYFLQIQSQQHLLIRKIIKQ